MNLTSAAIEAAAEAFAKAQMRDDYKDPNREWSSDDEHAEHVTAVLPIIRASFLPALESILAEVFDDGFTTCANQHTKQRNDPSHPITRVNPYRKTYRTEWPDIYRTDGARAS